MLNFTTDSDVIFYRTRFVADAIWYPEIASALSPRVLANAGCTSYEQVIPGKLEYLSVIGVALGLALRVRLCVGPEREDLQRLNREICH